MGAVPLVLPFNRGEYAIRHWGPALRVPMDGRPETVYSARTIHEQTDVDRGDAHYHPSLVRTQPGCLWLSQCDRTLADDTRLPNGCRDGSFANLPRGATCLPLRRMPRRAV